MRRTIQRPYFQYSSNNELIQTARKRMRMRMNPSFDEYSPAAAEHHEGPTTGEAVGSSLPRVRLSLGRFLQQPTTEYRVHSSSIPQGSHCRPRRCHVWHLLLFEHVGTRASNRGDLLFAEATRPRQLSSPHSPARCPGPECLSR